MSAVGFYQQKKVKKNNEWLGKVYRYHFGRSKISSRTWPIKSRRLGERAWLYVENARVARISRMFPGISILSITRNVSVAKR